MLILRLCVMMFIQYVIWGSWYVTVTNYMTTTLGFSGTQAGAAFGTTAVASLLAPFIVGLVADRFVATERLMAGLYALGAVIMVALTQVTSFVAVYSLLLAFCLCYFPTIALTNAMTMRSVKNPGKALPADPDDGDHRLDCDHRRRRLPEGRSDDDALPVRGGGLRRHVPSTACWRCRTCRRAAGGRRSRCAPCSASTPSR